MAGRKLKFPDPGDYAAKHPVVLCPADRVLRLFEQQTSIQAHRIHKTVKVWFSEEAKRIGWVGCRFVPEVQSAHGAGAMLLNPQSVKITVNQIVIELPKSGDDE